MQRCLEDGIKDAYRTRRWRYRRKAKGDEAIRRGLFFETKIRSFRATKINKNRGLIFKDNYCQLGCQFLSIRRGVILLCLMLIDFASMIAVCYSALKASFIAEYRPTINRL